MTLALSQSTALSTTALGVSLGQTTDFLHGLCSGDSPEDLDNFQDRLVSNNFIAQQDVPPEKEIQIELVRKTLHTPLSRDLETLASDLEKLPADRAVTALIASGIDVRKLPLLARREALSIESARHFIGAIRELQLRAPVPDLTKLPHARSKRRAAILISCVLAISAIGGAAAGYEIALSEAMFFASPELLLTGLLGGGTAGGVLSTATALLGRTLGRNRTKQRNLMLLDGVATRLAEKLPEGTLDRPYR